MFDRALEMKVVKKAKDMPEGTVSTDLSFDEKTKIIGRQVDKTVLKIGIVVSLYVVLDTVRQVLVTKANN